MKKTISINISGINFYIEEDGYEKLSVYLASIHRYFSSFEGSEEIVTDIEARIAEIFMQRLSPVKQAITLEDVDSVIATMGNISDFQEVEDPAEATHTYRATDPLGATDTTGYAGTTGGYTSTGAATEPTGAKKLYRDTKHKILGGVAAGIANYFTLDPLWIRLLLVVLVIFSNRTIRILDGTNGDNDIFVFNNSLSGLIILAYIICWVVIPGRTDLKHNENIRKLFRDPEEKVLGGVSGGLARYFGTDVIAIRLLFILLLFIGGFGFLLYIILWIITPEAKTLTDKMKMQGEPLTLANIEANIKNSLNIKPGQEESTAAKVLLFPFRLIALIFNKLAEILGPLMKFILEAIRILAGIMLIILSFAFMVASIALFGVSRGLINNENMEFDGFPVEAVFLDIPWYAAVMGFITLFIPALMLGIGGLSLIAKRKLINTIVGWTLFAIWLVAALVTSVTVAQFAQNFRSEGELEEITGYRINSNTLYLASNDRGDNNFNNVELRIRGYSGDSIRLERIYSAKGKNRDDASNNASKIIYNITQQDSVITFDTGFGYGGSNPFTIQEVNMDLYIPYGQTFEMDKNLRDILRSTLSPAGYSARQMANNKWLFTPEGLRCLTCSEQPRRGSRTSDDEERIEFNFDNFDRVNMGSAFRVNIIKGDEYSVVASGPAKYLDNVTFNLNGNELEANYESNGRRRFNFNDLSDRVHIDITMPELRAADIHGAADASINGFNNDNFALKMSGASVARVEINTNNAEVELSGASELKLIGQTRQLTADISGASELKSQEFIAEEVSIEASGASSASVYASERLDADASGASSIHYKGNPRQFSKDSSHGSSITKD
jgi:phage shock protein PspC (stress-responsive transcriptional regulator)